MATKSKGGSAADRRAVIDLPADCRIAQVGEMRERLLGSLGERSITLDGAAVERVDTAALQLLVAYRRECEKRGQSLDWAGASQPLHDAAGQLGLVQTLALPAREPA